MNQNTWPKKGGAKAPLLYYGNRWEMTQNTQNALDVARRFVSALRAGTAAIISAQSESRQ